MHSLPASKLVHSPAQQKSVIKTIRSSYCFLPNVVPIMRNGLACRIDFVTKNVLFNVTVCRGKKEHNPKLWFALVQYMQRYYGAGFMRGWCFVPVNCGRLVLGGQTLVAGGQQAACDSEASCPTINHLTPLSNAWPATGYMWYTCNLSKYWNGCLELHQCGHFCLEKFNFGKYILKVYF